MKVRIGFPLSVHSAKARGCLTLLASRPMVVPSADFHGCRGLLQRKVVHAPLTAPTVLVSHHRPRARESQVQVISTHFAFSHSPSNSMNAGFGRSCGRFSRAFAIALSRVQPCLRIRYAVTTRPLRLAP